MTDRKEWVSSRAPLIQIIVRFFAIVACAVASGMMAQTAPQPAPLKPRLTLASSGFEDGGIMPAKFTMASPATPVAPELHWSNVPEGTVSFVLMLHDPDTSIQKTTDEALHWFLIDIPSSARQIPENAEPQLLLPAGTVEILNQKKLTGYLPLAASSAGPYHHYIFELYALDRKLGLPADADPQEVMKAMSGHILMKGVLVGRFHMP